MRRSVRSTVIDFRKYGFFSKREWLNIAITSVVFGFIFSFRRWGTESFDAGQGIFYWTIFTLFSLFALLVMHFGHRLACVHFGYTSEYSSWKTGLFTNLFLCFITNGWFIFLTPGGFITKDNPGIRVGGFFKGTSFHEKAYIVFFGLFWLVIYAGLIKLLPIDPEYVREMSKVAYIIGAYSLLPLDLFAAIFHRSVTFERISIPPSNGSYLFFGDRGFAVFTLVFFGISYIANTFLSLVLGFLLSMLFATIAYAIWILFIDPNKLWKA